MRAYSLLFVLGAFTLTHSQHHLAHLAIKSEYCRLVRFTDQLGGSDTIKGESKNFPPYDTYTFITTVLFPMKVNLGCPNFFDQIF